MDAAKVMAFMAVNPGDVWDYIAGGTGKAQPRQAAPLPLVCVTTTAGTGSEADPYGVISNDETNEKIGFHADFPVLSIVDPELMLSVPQCSPLTRASTRCSIQPSATCHRRQTP